MSQQSSSTDSQAKCIYTAASANRNSHVVDWASIAGESGRADGITEVVYASDRNIAIANNVIDIHREPIRLIATPNNVLTVTKFTHPKSRNGKPKIIAGSEDGYLYLYSRRSDSSSSSSNSTEWHLHQQWQASPKKQSDQRKPAGFPIRKQKVESGPSVRALGVLRKENFGSDDDEEYLFASATSDGMLQVWRVTGDSQVELLQTISLGRSRVEARTEVLPLDIVLTRLPTTKNSILMAVSGTDSKIDLFLAEDGKSFTRLFSLLGHTDWVRSLDFCKSVNDDEAWVMLASGSQDHGIRLWRIEGTIEEAQQVENKAQEGDEFDKLASEIEDGEDEAIATKMQTFRCLSRKWNISFDALLIGHEHWVTGLRWAPSSHEGQPAALLSSSADNSVILWTPSSGVGKTIASIDLPIFDASELQKHNDTKDQDVWVALQRFGEIGNVGSAANGMYGVAWDPSTGPSSDRQTALAYGYGGAIHIWSRQKQDGRAQPWTPQPGLGGHFGSAMSVRWEPEGQYLISGGLDKTTRLHGCYRSKTQESWHEMARPQTHGYEIVALSWLSRLALASAGDEKVIRIFEAPRGFVQSAQNLNLVPKEQLPNLLTFYVADLAHLNNPKALTSTIKEATKKSLDKGRLDIVVVSPLFDGVEQGNAPKLTFEQAESFLKWCYAMTWSTAVEADKLLFDVNVFLIGTEKAQQKLISQRQADELYIVQEADFKLPFEIDGAISLDASSDSSEESHNSQNSSSDNLPQHEAIAMGGTFDHLHVGHKILLSMACLITTRRVVVGVTSDSMLSKKKHASVLESIETRIDRVSQFLKGFCNALGRTNLHHDVVTLQDVAGPAGTDEDLTALLFTDETVGGADFIDGERTKRRLEKLARFTIGVIGASGETDVKGNDASELAAAKVGSTAIRGWIEKNYSESGKTLAPSLEEIPTLNGEPRPVGASVPPLGLSNRAIFDTRDGSKNEPLDGPSETGQPIGSAFRSISSDLHRPPVEEQLHNQSLWSEVSKLYGHSLELAALDVDVKSGLVASSCKASHAELAGIRIHDSKQGWRERQVLMGHSLNVTRVRFSQDGQKLISVSRDRSWRLFARKRRSSEEKQEKDDNDDELFEQIAEGQEAHGRIIYDVTWCGNETFATSSRDGNVKVWNAVPDKVGKDSMPIATLPFKEPITAVAALNKNILAIGSETGHLWIYKMDESEKGWTSFLSISNLHADAINELAWQPKHDKNRVILASAGQDRAVRLTQFSF